MCRVKRRFALSEAVAYAEGVGKHTGQFRDAAGSIRAFLVEYSIIMTLNGQPDTALGLASIGLHDEVGLNVDANRLSYILVSLIKS